MILEKQKKIAIITGANSGVGFAICQRLLETEGDEITVVMACRNPSRAEKARELLRQQFPSGHIELELVDVGSMNSVFSFCQAVRNKYSHVNYLFCNAGILNTKGINWMTVVRLLFTDPVGLVERSDATVQNVGEINADGIGEIFAANVLGHYIMMREMEGLLDRSGDGRIIWTSSITAKYDCFDIDDWQGVKSKEPYESSKWACDLVSIQSNERFQREGLKVSSFTTSPGVVASHIGGLAAWIVYCRILVHYLMRILGVASQNISSYNGAIADVYVALAPLASLDYLLRYNSYTNRWGTPYVEALTIPKYDHDIAKKLVDKCELTYQAFKKSNSVQQ
ncbi:hypothetical protein EDC96DRAFT_524667 [Choanephora cucurbitarum]|nr:hypothetical protein EDC96DRAFT_524667 [Choanephora cucurbitarum]